MIPFTPGWGDVVLRGQAAHVAWSYHTAAVCGSWTARRAEKATNWVLTTDVARVDPFVLRQKGLQFLAPRVGGYFVWPILALAVQPPILTATLGPLEN